MLAKGLGGLAERDGGNREIVHQLRVAAERLAALAQDVEEAAGAVAGEAAAGEVHPLGERVPGLLVRLRAELGERVVDVTAEVLVRDIAAAVAHEPPLPRQQAVQGQPVEGRQDQALGQVAGRAEQDENRRPQIRAGFTVPLLGWHEFHAT